ncbi:MAG: MBL fold metallo-hydrolase [Pirellulales bacterium]|nr:MBL fold metallo-hydrolase [Pirellulales bacterium]
MQLAFFGAAGEVTGSCYLVELERTRFLVDCGMFQGGTDADRRNREPFAFDPRSIAFVLLTHAHIDHSGLLPKLAAGGFTGPIFCTAPTADLAAVMLRDAAHVQEQEASWRTRAAARNDGRRIRPYSPVYTLLEAERCVRRLHGVAYDQRIEPHPDVAATFRDAGHILGSAIIEVAVRAQGVTRKLTFSGDLGLPARPIVRDPTPITDTDVLVVESTYGDRRHRDFASTLDEVAAILAGTIGAGRGNVLFPAFAVGRAQSVLCVLAMLVRAKRSPPLEIYVDSPMAAAATEVTLRHRDVLDDETRALLAWIQTQPKEFRLRFTSDTGDSRALNSRTAGIVIVSASGMCDAGRIRHHLRHNLPRAGAAVVITGFQAAGTLGRRLVDRSPSVRLFGEDVPVRAGIHTVGGLSAHADQPALHAWLRHFRAPPQRTFVVHGEHNVATTFAESVRASLGWRDVAVPALGDAVPL